jgi:hypothetical protein
MTRGSFNWMYPSGAYVESGLCTCKLWLEALTKSLAFWRVRQTPAALVISAVG